VIITRKPKHRHPVSAEPTGRPYPPHPFQDRKREGDGRRGERSEERGREGMGLTRERRKGKEWYDTIQYD